MGKSRINTTLSDQLARLTPTMRAKLRICRKQGYASQGAAEAGARSLIKRGLHRPEEGRIRAYKCPRCQQWHTGHASEGLHD